MTERMGAGRPTRIASSGDRSGAVSTTEPSEDTEDLNLVEVSVYGLASLYERYPPRKEKPADASATAEKPAGDSAATKQ